MKMYAIPEVSLLNNKNFVQNYCTSNEGNRPHAKKWCDTQNTGVQGRATETKISRVSILQRRVFYRKIRKIWIFADSWKFARRPAGTLESLGFSPKEALMHQSGYECKLKKMYAILGVTLLKNKNFVQNYCTSNERNRPHAKSDATRKILCVLRGATETKISRVSILQRRVFYRNIRKI